MAPLLSPRPAGHPAAGRRIELDALKGVLIVLVVFGHVLYTGTAAPALERVRDWLYVFHAPAFFFLSAMLWQPPDEPAQGLRTLWNRLAGPYLFFYSVYLVALHLAGLTGWPTQTVMDSLRPAAFLRALLLEPIGAYWFVHQLIVYRLCRIWGRALLMRIPSLAGSGWAELALAAALLGAVWLTPVTLRIDAGTHLLAGAALQIFALPMPGTLWPLIPAALSWKSFAPGAIRTMAVVQLLTVFAVVSGWLFAVRMAGRREPGAAVVERGAWLGRRTLPVLLLHVYFLNLCKPLAGPLAAVDPTGLAHALLATLAGVAGPLLLQHWWEMFREKRIKR